MRPTRWLHSLPSLLAAACFAVPLYSQEESAKFQVVEATIAQIHQAMSGGRLSCQDLVRQYLARIEAYDKQGPAINALVVVHPGAMERAAELDAQFARSGLSGPLHCIPVIVKDNLETTDLPTTAGSLSLKGYISSKDAFIVRRLREAGAIVLAKSNMAEFAFSPYETVNSILPGYSKNPYAPDRVTAGSSGGTAAAVAASFGTVGLGTDTGNSIRGPSAHQALAGIRPTMGLVSRGGIVPLNLASDVAGPMTRTLEDAIAVLQVIAGHDPADPVTAAGADKIPKSYAASLIKEGLKGARLGVLHQAYETKTTDPEVVDLFQQAIRELEKCGAAILDPVEVPGLEELRRSSRGSCNQFKYDLNRYLAGLDPKPPVMTLEEIIRGRQFHPSIEKRLETAQAVDLPPEENPGCSSRDEFRTGLRAAVLRLMDEKNLDALIYPTWSNAPRLIGDLNTPHGDNNQLFAPSTGFPAITIPMGYLRGNLLPAGLQFFGRAWSEPTLIKLAYSYEQATRHRRPPPSTPPLRHPSSGALDGDSHSRAAAYAESRQAQPVVAGAEGVQQRDQNPRAGASGGVTQRDRTAVHIPPRCLPGYLSLHGQHLRGEGLVELDEFEVPDLQAGSLQQLPGGRHGTEPHFRGVNGCGRESPQACKRL